MDLEGRACRHNPATQQLVVLNETATDVWHLWDGEHAEAEAVDLLVLSYCSERSAVADDVAKAIRGFRDAGLLVS